MAKQRILVVEDEQDIANLLKAFFSSQGYEVLVAHRGSQALEIARRQSPHLALLDINLPDMEGYEIARVFRETPRTRHIPILFVTARGARGDKLRGLELGADDYIVKPFDLDELNLKVRNALRRVSYEALTNPTTGLPGTRLIEEHLRKLIRQDNWALASLVIDHFSEFNDVYGFVAGDDALRFAAGLIGEVLDVHGTPQDFVGHIGGGEFVITSSPEALRKIVRELARRFDEEVGLLYSYEDRKAGYILVQGPEGDRQVPLMSLVIGIVDGSVYEFSDIREVGEAASEARQQARLAEPAIEGGRSRFAELE